MFPTSLFFLLLAITMKKGQEGDDIALNNEGRICPAKLRLLYELQLRILLTWLKNQLFHSGLL